MGRGQAKVGLERQAGTRKNARDKARQKVVTGESLADARASAMSDDEFWGLVERLRDSGLNDDAMIEAVRREARIGNAVGDSNDNESWNRGACHLVTELLEGIDGAERVGGYFIAPSEDDDPRPQAIDHFWLRMPDGTLIDPTYDSINAGHESIGRFQEGDPRREPYQEYAMHDRSWHQRYAAPGLDLDVASRGSCDDCILSEDEEAALLASYQR